MIAGVLVALAAGVFVLPLVIARIRGRKVRSCLLCGCTDDRACPGGCWWVGDRLCSRCGPVLDRRPT